MSEANDAEFKAAVLRAVASLSDARDLQAKGAGIDDTGHDFADVVDAVHDETGRASSRELYNDVEAALSFLRDRELLVRGPSGWDVAYDIDMDTVIAEGVLDEPEEEEFGDLSEGADDDPGGDIR